MPRISLTETAQRLVAAHLRDGGSAIDATLGNGHDTVFLAEQVGPGGLVYGFDIQTQALENTRHRLAVAGLLDRVRLCRACHSTLAERIPPSQHGRIQAAMFNLGYLPGADKSIITRPETSLAAVAVAARLLAIGGVLTITVYPGHVGGAGEANALSAWSRELAGCNFELRIIDSSIENLNAPRLFALTKLQLAD